MGWRTCDTSLPKANHHSERARERAATYAVAALFPTFWRNCLVYIFAVSYAATFVLFPAARTIGGGNKRGRYDALWLRFQVSISSILSRNDSMISWI